MKTITPFIDDNLRYLQQADDLIANLTDTVYASQAPSGLGSSIGAHIRHCLDHYQSFLHGLATAQIDYDARQREPEIETERSTARAKIAALAQGLREASTTPDASVQINMDCGGQTKENLDWTESSLRRELQFLISHTVHHFAIIKMMLLARGLDAAPTLGLAPSTLRYQQSTASCAH